MENIESGSTNCWICWIGADGANEKSY